MSDLIDTTEMYLRTIYELIEEGVAPLRVRIVERLGQSGPTVSQTVARMERDGLLHVRADRQIELTDRGMQQATRVMRKHRLAERLLVDVIGLDWDRAHAEACRWEHVISDDVERRLLDLLDHPTESPFGTPIPGLAELDATRPTPQRRSVRSLTEATDGQTRHHTIAAIPESLQQDAGMLAALRRAGVHPGSVVKARRTSGGQILLGTAGEYAELDAAQAAGVMVLAE